MAYKRPSQIQAETGKRGPRPIEEVLTPEQLEKCRRIAREVNARQAAPLQPAAIKIDDPKSDHSWRLLAIIAFAVAFLAIALSNSRSSGPTPLIPPRAEAHWSHSR